MKCYVLCTEFQYLNFTSPAHLATAGASNSAFNVVRLINVSMYLCMYVCIIIIFKLNRIKCIYLY